MHQPRNDQDGWRPSAGFLAIALALAVGGLTWLFYLWMSHDEVAQAPASAAAPTPPVAQAEAVARAPVARPVTPAPAATTVEGDADPTRDLRSYVARGENPTMGEVIARLHERGIHTGLGALSPPGTNPPMVGIAVPENFALPPGYVRHHQVTDDGQTIEPILMYAPDFQPLDASNRPIPIPANRVVPAAMAPPGLPVRLVTIPAPLERR